MGGPHRWSLIPSCFEFQRGVGEWGGEQPLGKRPFHTQAWNETSPATLLPFVLLILTAILLFDRDDQNNTDTDKTWPPSRRRRQKVGPTSATCTAVSGLGGFGCNNEACACVGQGCRAERFCETAPLMSCRHHLLFLSLLWTSYLPAYRLGLD